MSVHVNLLLSVHLLIEESFFFFFLLAFFSALKYFNILPFSIAAATIQT